MKKTLTRSAALLVCAGAALSLTACGGSAASSEAASSTSAPASSAVSEPDPMEEEIAAFDYSEGITEDGFFADITALDYVTLPEGYRNLQIPATDIAVTDEEVQESIDSMLQSCATTEQDTESAIENGDNVNIDYVGSVDGVEFVGGSTQGAGTTVTAGSTEYVDDFLTQIIGHKPGETFDVVVTFPEQYPEGKDAEGNAVVLANQEAVFAVTVNYINRTVIPEFNDEFVQSYADPQFGTTAEEFRATLVSDMETNKKQTFVYNYMMENSVFAEELPESLNQYNSLAALRYYYDYAQSYGLTFSDIISGYLGAENAQALLDTNWETVLQQSKQSLMYQAVAEDMSLKCTQEDVDNYFANVLRTTDTASYVEMYGENYLRMNTLSNNVIETLSDSASVN